MAKDELESHGFQVIGGFLSPANDHYAKPDLISSIHRIKMCELALKSSNWVSVDSWEAEQPQWPTTVSVLESFRRRLDVMNYNKVAVMLVAGADLVQSFQVPNLWSEADQERIVGEFGLAVIERAGVDLSEIILSNSILFKHKVYHNI